jgi:hypothetical protein
MGALSGDSADGSVPAVTGKNSGGGISVYGESTAGVHGKSTGYGVHGESTGGTRAYLGFDRCSIAALAGLAGALSTAVHAAGKSLSFRPADEPPNSGIFIRRIESANQWSSDLSHSSPPGTAGCARQFGESAGHFRRTWMWSSWPYQGRTLDIHNLSFWLSTRQSSFFIAALTRTRSTSGCSAAVRMKATSAGLQILSLTCFPSAATTLLAKIFSRSSLLNT